MPKETIGDVEHVVTAGHPARKDSAEYTRTRKWLMTTPEGCYVCGGPVDLSHPGVPVTAGMQDHHGGAIMLYPEDGSAPILVGTNLFGMEWSLGWGADPVRVAAFVAQINEVTKRLGGQPYTADIATTADVMSWVDGEGNASVKLCLVGDTPVRMEGGREAALADVRIGDRVLGHDGKFHHVSDTMQREWSGSLVVVDGFAMTPNHPVLTPDGWVRAERLTLGTPVLSHVRSMRFVELEVLNSVVEPVPVDVVDALGRCEAPTDVALHHKAVLHDGAPAFVLPDLQTPVALLGDRRRALVGSSLSVEDYQAALVAGGDLSARFRAGLVGPLEDGDYQVATSADLARLSETHARLSLGRGREFTSRVTRWRPIREIRRRQFRGVVHDLTVVGSHSFTLGGAGMVVHNCAPHHIGHEAKHTPDVNGHEAVGIHNGPVPIWLGQATADWQHWDMWGGSTGTIAVGHPGNDSGEATVLHVSPLHPDKDLYAAHQGALATGDTVTLPASHPHARLAHAGAHVDKGEA